MPKRRSGKLQRAQGKKKRKNYKLSVSKTDESSAKSSHSHGITHEDGDPATHAPEYSANWKTLAKQLGLDTARKEHHQGNADEADSQESTFLTVTSRNNDAKGDRHKSYGDPFSRGKAKTMKSSASTSRKRKRIQIWFDDVPLEMVEGEPVPKRSKTAPSARLVTGNDKTAGKCVSLDCEMVGTGWDGEFSMLARCSIVNHHGNVLYDSYVAPMDRVTDYRTRFSGIRPRDLVGAPDFKSVQKSVSDIITGRKLVGHGIQNDLKVLLLSHPKKDIRDTSKYKPFRTLSNGGTPGLCKLAKEILRLEIHDKEHDSIEDARIAMRLYQICKRKWEYSLKTRSMEIKETKPLTV